MFFGLMIHYRPIHITVRYWNTFKKEFPECLGTTNLNCVDFLSASDGIVPANH
jgi:hypothetical protein